MNKLKSLTKKDYILMLIIVLVGAFLCVIGKLGYDYLKGKSTNDTLFRLEKKVKISKKKVNGTEYEFLKVDLNSLREKNSDICGWLKVGVSNIDIPIVQTTDNEFYLDKDIDKKQNASGWLFVDYKNNIEHLDTNTVIYGHNMANGQMFGTLKDLLNKGVIKEEKDTLVQMSTDTKDMVFQIVSVYITEETDLTYFDVSFNDNTERQHFIDSLKEKNSVEDLNKYNKDLTVNDNILTFSTCHGQTGTSKRLVVHARLIASQSVLD